LLRDIPTPIHTLRTLRPGTDVSPGYATVFTKGL